MPAEDLFTAEKAIVLLLFVASLVAITARRVRIPYTVGLVLIGLGLTLLVAAPFDVPPDLILALLVPPILFEAAFHIRIEDLQRDFWVILLLAIPGVVLTTLMVGGLVSWGTGLAIQAAMVFGALVAATDPVAVVALFRRLGMPRRLQVLLEGESLFNDGTAIVVFNLALAIALEEQAGLSGSVSRFVTVAGAGSLIGVILGMIISQIIGRIDDPLVETTLTTVLALGSYLVAESLNVSGVLAVVAAGIVNGNVGPRGMSPTTRVVVFNFWEYAAFLSNSLIFLLIGLTIDLDIMLLNWRAIGWAILAVLLARAVSIYGFSLFGRDILVKWKHVLYWGGLRGAIVLALALSLPETGLFAAERERLQAMAFGVVLFTLLVQGFSMDWLVKRLQLIQRPHFQEEYERRHARLVAARAASDYLRRMSQQGVISEHTWQRLAPLMERQSEMLIEAIREVMTRHPVVEAEELDTARREALRAQRNALIGLLRDGVISEETYSQLVGEVDAALTEEHLSWMELLQTGSAPSLPVKRLMVAVIHPRDMEKAVRALSRQEFAVARLPSSGGFLSRRSVMLLIGLPQGREAAAVKTLHENCRRRVELTAWPLRDLPFSLPVPRRVQVGGATIFTFEVESYDEF